MNNPLPLDQEFPIQFNEYAAFDALSLKSLMQDRLTVNGTFTDQVYEGSNFNNLLDIVAYSYNVLVYYLNQTGNEGLFSSSQIYENMNKIVKLVNYKPMGPTTSILNYNATATSDISPGVYTIPRFSYFTVNDIYYSFNQDATFVKSVTGVEILSDLTERTLLYQGEFIEYPIYISTGENFEEVSVVSVDQDGINDSIDNNNIYVFVRGNNGKWVEYSRVDNLFLQNGVSESFEVRFNENQRYVIKFGNNVTGKKLTSGNLVAIYYLKTEKARGNIGPGTLDGNKLFFLNTERLNVIMGDVKGSELNYLTIEEANNIAFSNTDASIPYTELEDTKLIRQNAPNYFKRQGRIVTTADFESYIKQNFNNLITDVKVVNNWEYLNEHIGYMYNLGLDNPMVDSRILYNQVNFADSCNFNNMYVYVIPRTLVSNEFSFSRGFLNLGLKDYILSKLTDLKLSTIEVIFQDPIFMSIGFGSASQDEIFNKKLTVDIANDTKLYVVKSPNNSVGSNEIKERVSNIILNYFSFTNTKLGQYIEIDKITQSIFNIGGIESVYTQRNGIRTPGLNFIGYNVAYSNSNEDISLINQPIKLPYFKIPYWNNRNNILNQIEVVTSSLVGAGTREY